jgi:hypothetical protein
VEIKCQLDATDLLHLVGILFPHIPMDSSPLKGPPVRTEREALRDNQKGRFGQEKVLLLNYGNRTTFVQTVG